VAFLCRNGGLEQWDHKWKKPPRGLREVIELIHQLPRTEQVDRHRESSHFATGVGTDRRRDRLAK
jgi:hypothetical protein